MDTSEQYIEMCEAASEDIGEQEFDQSRCPVCGGDWWGGKYIFLYRQDQLQEMILSPEPIGSKENYKYFYFIEHFSEEVLQDSYYQQFHSMEQILLAVLMKCRFHKIWDGEKWK